MPMEMTVHCMDSMPARLQLVLRRHGGRTGYYKGRNPELMSGQDRALRINV
jgi:hypothetical protein